MISAAPITACTVRRFPRRNSVRSPSIASERMPTSIRPERASLIVS